MGDQHDLVRTLAAGGDRAHGLAEAICLLIKDGAELGALETHEIADAGHPDAVDGVRTVKRVPRIWLTRLERAIELGAFERLPVRKIVDRILAPPLPGAES